MSAPRGYIKRTPFSRASDEMLEILSESESERVREKAFFEIERRRLQ